MAKKTSPSSTYTRSYLLKVDPRCNKGKLQTLETMYQEWKRLLPVVGSYLWQRFLMGHYNDKSLSSTVGTSSVFGKSILVSSIRCCMAVAIEGQIKSWQSNVANRMVSLLMRTRRLQDPNRHAIHHQMLWINNKKLWLASPATQQMVLSNRAGKTALTVLDPHASAVMARYMRKYICRFKAPYFDNLPMQLNAFSGKLIKPVESQDTSITYWLSMTTPIRNADWIDVPILGNSYADQFNGLQAKTLGLLKENDQWFVKVCKKFEKPLKRSTKDKKNVLGLDSGMVNLLATSQGAIFGQGFNMHLRRWDEALQRITKGLQGAGEKKLSQCKHYQDFVRRMRGWITSQVKCAVKKALALGQPHAVVIEALTFSSQAGTLSRKMNRLVRRMGTGVIKRTLEMKSEEQGFTLVKVNPAYTSQECRSCGYINRKNRKGNKFVCVCCGKQAHADSQGARTLVERFHSGRVCEYVKHSTLGMQGLDIWAARMRTRIEKATPGTSRLEGAVGCARAGLKHLDKKKAMPPEVQKLKSLLIGYRGGIFSTRKAE